MKMFNIPKINRWSYYELWANLLSFGKERKCTVCGFKSEKAVFKEITSRCIFVNEHLIRYTCPQCGVIFGPVKFLLLPRFVVAREYANLYSKYSEGDTTEYEMKTFEHLRPTKEGVYLNFGSGLWSKSIEKLRDAGWNVYGFEPYAKSTNTSKSHILTSLTQVRRMKFDGVFSHNLIEHLFNPISDFILMKSLLKDSRSLLAHSTACYDYIYDFSIFHVHFYTGKSVQYLANRTKLNITHHVKDNETEYQCYIFDQADSPYL
jgi:ribosomal protein S27AE